MDVALYIFTHGLAMNGPSGTFGKRPGSCIPGGTAEWPPTIKVVYPKRPGGKSILWGSFVLCLQPVYVPPIALCIHPSVTPTAGRCKSGTLDQDEIPFLQVLSQCHSLAGILPDGQDLLMLV